MLEGIRNKRNSIVILAVFAAIIIVFIFWGVGPSGDDNDTSVVASVDGTKISAREYAALYQRQVDYYRDAFKGQPVDDMEKRLDLKHRTLNMLINRRIALDAAYEEGIKVSREDVQEAIKSIPAFGNNGVFDIQRYREVLSGNRLNPAEFEKNVEEDLIVTKMREHVISGVKVGGDEARDAYFKGFRKVDLDYIVLDGSRFRKGVEVTKEEGMKFLKENGSLFVVPARVKVFYTYADYAVLTKKADVTDAEAKDYYEKNSNDYMTPAEVKARHILIRPDPKAQDRGAAMDTARKKADEILAELKAGADFEKLAKEYSMDPGSASQNGDLGWFERGVMITPFEDAAFSMKKGELSGVVETEFGFHIIRVDDRKDSALKPFDRVKGEIREKLAEHKGGSAARAVSLDLMNRFREAKTVEELEKDASAHPGVKSGLTPLFSEADDVELTNNEMIRDVVFSMKQDEVSRLIETPEGIYVIKMVEKINPHVPEYDAVAGRINQALVERKALEAAGAKAKELLEKAKGGQSLKDVAAKEQFKVERTGYFSRAEGVVPKIGAFVADKPALFELTEGKPVYLEVMIHEGRFYVFSLASAEEAPEAGFAEKKDAITKGLLNQKQEEAINNWFEQRRAKARIKVFEERL